MRLRAFRREDTPGMVAIVNATWPDDPTTVEAEEHYEDTYPADNPRLRLAVEAPDGHLAAEGVCMKPFWLDATAVYSVWIMVDPPWRRRGIGRALLAALEPFASAGGATRLWTDSREDHDFTARFLERAGFTVFGRRFESAADLTAFDPAQFADVEARVAAAGYEITTLAAERAARPGANLGRALFDVAAATIGDVPYPGGAHFTMTWHDFESRYLTGPHSDAAAFFVAKRAGPDGAPEYVGLTTTELRLDAPAYTGFTAVLRAHRGRGVGLALKAAAFRLMQARGYTEARTHNDTANPAILALNTKLGYRPLPGWLLWEKAL